MHPLVCHPRIFATFVLCVLFLVSPLGIAQTFTVEPGEYITQGGWGTLKIVREQRELSFSIYSLGGNGHQCVLGGSIKGGEISLEDNDSSNPCVIQLATRDDGIDVQQSSRDACSIYCGARAGFSGFYFKPTNGCTEVEVRAKRTTFKKLFDNKQYSHASAILESVLLSCTRTLLRWDEYWIRNDLALSQFKSGDSIACLSTLAPLTNDANARESKVLDDFAPAETEIYRKILRATRTNLRLCHQK